MGSVVGSTPGSKMEDGDTTTDEERSEQPSPGQRDFRPDNLTSRPRAWRRRQCFPSRWTAQTYRPPTAADGRPTQRAWTSRRCATRSWRLSAARCSTSAIFDDFPVSLNNLWDGHRHLGLRRPEGLRRPDEHQGHRALHAHDHRSGRSGARSDVWVGHDGLRRRAVGAAVDHDRHLPRRACPRPHPADGGQVPLLPAGRLG